jgi:GT2 family glycosyltransferase
MAPASVTCVIPTHHRDDSLVRAVDSVVRQTMVPERIVIVDDTGRSADRQAIRDLLRSAPNIDFRDSSGSSNPGASWSRNVGARGAVTEYLAFLDDDDMWLPTYIERQLDRIDQRGADLTIAWGALLRDGKRVDSNWTAHGGATARSAVTTNPGITGSNFLIRRSAFEEQGGFDPGMWVWNDLDFFVRFLEAGKTYTVVPEDLVAQTIDGGAHLSSRSERRAQGLEAYRAKHEALMTRADKRKMRRFIHLARMHGQQPRVRYLRHLAGAAICSTPSDWSRAISRRLEGSVYG